MKNYGKELVLDLHDCNPERFTKRCIKSFFMDLCRRIDMEQEDLHFWGYDDPKEKAKAPAHLKGISAVQFITTSTIIIHTLDDLKSVYINIFSCKDFSSRVVKDLCEEWFEGRIVNATALTRI